MKRCLSAVCALLLLPLVLSGCGGRDRAPSDDGIYTGWIETASVREEVTHSMAMSADPFEQVPDAFDDLAETGSNCFTYVSGAEGLTITAYVGGDEVVRVPERIGGVPVVAIGDAAFAGQTGLKAIYLPDTVTQLGEGILAGCTALEELRTPLLGASPTAAQTLGYLFGAASYEDHSRDVPASLSYVELGDPLTELAAYAFYDCNDLQSVCLSERITSLGNFCFYRCEKLENINLAHLNAVGEYAFADCKDLRYVIFSSELQSIGRGAFEGCQFSEIHLPFIGGTHTENRFLGYIFGAESAEQNAGYSPGSLMNVRILEGCTSIAENAFYGCADILWIQLPSTIVSVGTRAFEGCESLCAISLPDACTTVGANAFYGCFSLRRVRLGSGLSSLGINAFYYCISLGSIHTPAALKQIPASAFAGCRALSSVTMDGATSIGRNAFRGCGSLAEASVVGAPAIAAGNDALTSLLEK